MASRHFTAALTPRARLRTMRLVLNIEAQQIAHNAAQLATRWDARLRRSLIDDLKRAATRIARQERLLGYLINRGVVMSDDNDNVIRMLPPAPPPPGADRF